MNTGLNMFEYDSFLLATIPDAGTLEYNLDCKIL